MPEHNNGSFFCQTFLNPKRGFIFFCPFQYIPVGRLFICFFLESLLCLSAPEMQYCCTVIKPNVSLVCSLTRLFSSLCHCLLQVNIVAGLIVVIYICSLWQLLSYLKSVLVRVSSDQLFCFYRLKKWELHRYHYR